ncbi:MAG: DedA family protein [Treponema sp.]|nr:DedA family protein [Treponema sp.]
MEQIIAFITSYVSYWPIVCFFALLLAGLNLPVSEDAMIILSATFVQADESLLIPTYIALYAGIVISDVESYFVGKLLSKGVLKFNFLKKKLTPERIERISTHLHRHGFLTFIVCRFIPFGVRNILFMGSGFTGLKFSSFILFDSIAAIISSGTLFALVYFIGEAAQRNFRLVGIILFIILVIVLAILIIRHIIKKRNRKIQESSEKID